MFYPKATAIHVSNAAGSGITSIASSPSFDLEAGEFVIVAAAFEVANATMTISDNSTGNPMWTPLPRAYDGSDVKGAQAWWLQAAAAKTAFVATVAFSTGVGFADLWLLRYKVDGTVTVRSISGINTATASTALSIPQVIGADLHFAAVKGFSGLALSAAATPPYPYGIRTDGTGSSLLVLDSTRKMRGAFTASGTFDASENTLCFAASFTDSGAPPAATTIPAWYRNAAAGTCVAIPGTSCDAHGLNVNNGTSLFTSAIFSAWGGGVLTTKGYYHGAQQVPGGALVVWGSGHTNGSNNEVLCYGPITSEYPRWQRLRDNTNPAPTNVTFDASGNPVARHTYQSIVYDGSGTRNRMLSVGGQGRATDADGVADAHYFDLDLIEPHVGQPWAQPGHTTGGSWWTATDPTTGINWGFYGSSGGNHIKSYDTGSGTVTDHGAKTGFSGSDGARCALDYTRSVLIASTGDGTIRSFDIANPGTADFVTLSPSGTAPTTISAMLYDPVDDRFVCYAGSNTLYFLTYSGSWAWSSTTFTGDTADSAQANGTYGRFALVNIGQMRGYLLVNGISSRAYLFRPSSSVIKPTVLADPGAVSIVANDKAYLQVVAQDATSYQWQDNRSGSFANCSDGTGATSAQYVTAALATGATGRQYRCVVTNASGSVNSAAAAVTVLAATSGSLGQFDPDLRIEAWF